MHNMWSYITVLLPALFTFPTSAATLPPSLHLISNANILSNGSERFVHCLAKPNATYPIYDSPLELAITLGPRPFLSWQLANFLEYVLIAIKTDAAQHPKDHIPEGYYYYHKPNQLGAVTVVPAFTRPFTWSDLYLVLHGLAEYAVTAPNAYEMCVEIIFRTGGFAGVIFLNWWIPDSSTSGKYIGVREAGNRRHLDLHS